MLALTIPVGESVKIGDNIVVHNTDSHGLKIAIEAPKDVAIERSNRKKTK